MVNAPEWATASAAPDWVTKPAQSGVPAWAQRTPQQIGGEITDPESDGLMGTLKRVGKTIEGNFGSAVHSGFSGLVARKFDEATNYAFTPWSTDKLTKDNPNQDPEITKKIQQSYERAAVLSQRQKYGNEVAANSKGFSPAGFAGSVAGSVDPSWLINPGVNITKNLGLKGLTKGVATIGANAATHAAMGSADDAVYQIADNLDKLQKGFDIKRNLEAAGLNAAFGATHAGIKEFAPHVSSFVNDLFTERGVDTLPSEDPRQSKPTTPLSGQPLKPEETAQLHELMNTGSEQDIKEFFKGRNGPQPKWDEVHKWVKYRDGVPEGFAQEEFKPKLDLEAEQSKQSVRDHIVTQTKEWKNAPDFEVVHDVNEIENPEVRQHAIDQGANDANTLGFVGPDNKVRIFANRIDSPDTLNAVLYHEALGHYGLQQKFGESLDKTLTTLMDRNVGKFNQRVDEWQKKNPGAYNGDRVRAAEEVLAEDSQNGQIKPSVVDAITAQVRRYGRRMGVDLSYSDREINTILGMAHDAVINGNGRDVRANGFRYNKIEENAPQEQSSFNEQISPEIDQTIPEDNKFMNRSQLAASTDYTVKSLQETYTGLSEDYEPTTRNWEETRRAALEAGFKPSQIKDLADVKKLDEKLYRMGAAAHMLDMKIDELNKKLDTPQWSMQDKADYIQAVADYNYMLQRIRDNRSEVARALNISKAIGYTRAQMDSINEMLEREGGTLSPLADDETFLKFARAVKTFKAQGNTSGAHALVQGVTKPYWWQYLLSFRQNMMLSAMSTHLKATMDMAINAGRDIEESTLALPGGLIRNVINGLGGNVKTGVHPTEIAGKLWGLARAAAEAKTYKDTLQSFKDGFQHSSTFGPAMPDIPIANIPSKMIAAQDTFFRSFLHNANLYELGSRQAYSELKAASKGGKVKWDDVMALGSTYAQSPTPEMLEAAHEAANQTILMNKSPINALIGQAKAIKPGMNGIQQTGSFLANLLTTFTRIQSNAFMNQVIRRSPLFFLDKVTRDDLRAGGARADIAVSRVILGTTLMGMYWSAADPKKDKFTGEGPESSAKRSALEASGWRPNAIHEDGQYKTGNTLNLSLNPFDMHNNTAIMVAGVRQAYEEGKNKADIATGMKLAAYAIMHDFTSSTFLDDVAPAVEAFTARGASMGQKIQKFAANEARTFMPNITTQAAKIIDPNQHDTNNEVVSSVLANIPGVTDHVPIKYSVYGEPLKTGTTVSGLHTWMSPGNHQDEPTDPTIIELSRLEKEVPGTLVSPVQKTLRIMGAPVKLTTEQFEEYQKYAGQTIVEAIKDEMTKPEWNKMSDQDKVDYVKDIERDAKSQVKEALLQKEGWLNENQLNSLRKQLNGSQ